MQYHKTRLYLTLECCHSLTDASIIKTNDDYSQKLQVNKCFTLSTTSPKTTYLINAVAKDNSNHSRHLRISASTLLKAESLRRYQEVDHNDEESTMTSRAGLGDQWKCTWLPCNISAKDGVGGVRGPLTPNREKRIY